MLKQVFRDSLIYSLASVMTRGLAILLLPIYTRVLSTAEYGAYDIIITVGALANVIVALEVSQGYARLQADVDSVERKQLASTALLFILLVYGIFIGICFGFQSVLNGWLLGDPGLLPAFRWGVLFIAANGVYVFLLSQLRWGLKSREYAVASVLFALVTFVVAAFLCMFLDFGLSGVVIAQLTAAISGAICCLVFSRESFRVYFSAPKLLAMLHFSVPLVPASLAVFANLYASRVALKHFASLEDVGLYGIASRLGGASLLLVVGIQAALTPLVYKEYQNPDTPKQIARLFHGFLAVVLPGCLGLSVFAPEILHVFTTPDFYPAAPLIVLLAPAILASQLYVFVPGMAIKKKTHWQLLATLIAAFVSIAGNWLLVPHLGATGAAGALILSTGAFLVVWGAFSQHLYPIPFHYGRILFCVFIYCVLAYLGWKVSNFGWGWGWLVTVKFAVVVFMVFAVARIGLLDKQQLSGLLGKVKGMTGRGLR